MSKAEWGTKHLCTLCGVKFYDMQRQPPTCPGCGSVRDESISHLDHKKIVKRWIDAVSVISDEQQKDKHKDARVVIDTIDVEWKKQRENKDFFKWPTTDAPSGTGPFSIDPPERGMLAYLGYRVGENGKLRRERQQILLEVFSSQLPPIISWSYLDEWGQPKSTLRLKKIAETIAALTRNAKRRNSACMTHAIGNWEKDLDFLKEELYVGKFGFSWPPTEQ